MNDDIEALLRKANIEIMRFDFNPSLELADIVQKILTDLKLMIGIEKFNELPYYDRYLSKVTRYINEIESAKKGKTE